MNQRSYIKYVSLSNILLVAPKPLLIDLPLYDQLVAMIDKRKKHTNTTISSRIHFPSHCVEQKPGTYLFFSPIVAEKVVYFCSLKSLLHARLVVYPGRLIYPRRTVFLFRSRRASHFKLLHCLGTTWMNYSLFARTYFR